MSIFTKQFIECDNCGATLTLTITADVLPPGWSAVQANPELSTALIGESVEARKPTA